MPAARLHKVRKNFTDYQAALTEPLATPVQAVRLAGDLTGKKVVILGAGTIGLLTLIAARRAGVAKIVRTGHRRRNRLRDHYRAGADQRPR